MAPIINIKEAHLAVETGKVKDNAINGMHMATWNGRSDERTETGRTAVGRTRGNRNKIQKNVNSVDANTELTFLALVTNCMMGMTVRMLSSIAKENVENAIIATV